MVEIVPFKRGHIAPLDVSRNDAGAFRKVAGRNDYLDRLEASTAAFSGFCNGEYLGSAGLCVLWPGVAEGWMILSPAVDRHRKSFHSCVSRKFLTLVKELGLHRVQATVLRGDYRAAEWIRRLGFEYEGDMPGYGPDMSTYMRYGRVRCPF